MERWGRGDAEQGDDAKVGAPGNRGSRRVSPPRLRVLLPLLSLLALLVPAAASAAETGHTFSKVINAVGKCAFTEAGDVAVDEVTHEVFVYDRGKNSLDRFNGNGTAGECTLHKKLVGGEAGEATNEGIAVDNSATSPSRGDIYVVNPGAHEIAKYKVEPGGALKLVHIIKKFKNPAEGKEGEYKEFGEIYGLAVDSKGDLWVYEGAENRIWEFSNVEPPEVQTLLSELTFEATCASRPGFALAPGGGFYVARERENRSEGCEEATAMVRLNSAGEPFSEPQEPETPQWKAQLDNDNTTGTAVDLGEGATKGDVYFDNVSSVAAFNGSGEFLQRVGAEGPGKLSSGGGVGLDASTNNLYVVDLNAGSEGQLELFTPSEIKEPGPEPPPTSSAPLADSREWEQVSPASKNGAQLYAITLEEGLVQASESGNALTFSSSGPLSTSASSNRSPEPVQNLARRGSYAWASEQITPPRSSSIPEGFAPDGGDAYRQFTGELSKGLVEEQEGVAYPGLLGTDEPPLSPDKPETTVYWRDLAAGDSACEPVPSPCYQPLVSSLNDTTGTPYGSQVEFVASTSNGEYSVVHSGVALTAEAKSSSEEGLYEYGPGGTLKLVSVLPSGETETSPVPDGLGRFTSAAVGIDARHALSDNGERVVWSTEEGLYLRDTVKGETVRLDVAQGGLTQPEEPGLFQTANAEGTRIFFTDKGRLVPNPEAPEEAEEELGRGDLYECEVTETGGKLGCDLKDLTAEVEAHNGPAAVQGVIGASEDGTTIYYVADGILSGGVSAGNCDLREGEQLRKEELEGKVPVLHCNVYEQHLSGSSWETPRFIATLTTEDLNDWTLTTERGALGTLTSRVSPHGTYMAFMSDLSLTGYNNVVPGSGGKRAEEVYLWNSASGRILCASCNPSGAAPQGVFDTKHSGEGNGLFVDRPFNWEGRWLDGSIPGYTGVEVGHALYQSRYLSDTGRLFFDSTSALVEADRNKKEDVYEYEPGGEGSCTSSTGCISLLSGGRPTEEVKNEHGEAERFPETESAFLDASVSGNDVFFLSSAKLAKSDTDDAFDVYDAHACTSSSPCLEAPPASEKECEGEGCRPARSTQPAGPSVPPTTQPGAGNKGTQQVLSNKVSVLPPPKPPKPLTRAQRLAKALKACKIFKKKHKRKACEAQARKKYGPLKKGHKSSHSAHKAGVR
jgi:hypothetical protein